MTTKYVDAVTALTDSPEDSNCLPDQATLLLSTAYEIDCQLGRLVLDASRLAETFVECHQRISRGQRGTIRADLAADLAGEQAKYETAVLYLRRTVRLLFGADAMQRFDAALSGAA